MSKRNPVLPDNDPKTKKEQTKAEKNHGSPVKKALVVFCLVTAGYYLLDSRHSKKDGKNSSFFSRLFGEKEISAPAVSTTPTKTKADIAATAKVNSVTGTVLLSGSAVADEDIITQGSVLETKAASSVILELTIPYNVTIRLTENTKLNIDELFSPHNFFHLLNGAIYVDLHHVPDQREINFKAFGVSFKASSGIFFLTTDGSQNSLISVKQGEVNAENFKTSTSTFVSGERTYLVNKNGNEKISASQDLAKQFDWDGDKPTEQANLKDMIALIGDLSTAPTAAAAPKDAGNDFKKVDSLKDDVMSELRIFEQYNQQLFNDLEAEKNKIDEMVMMLKVEAPKIKNDLACLDVNEGRCRLYSEKLLATRGFPTTFGAPKIRDSIIEDLNKYLKEKDAEIVTAQEEYDQGQILLRKRTKILKWAQESMASHAPLGPIFEALTQKTLFR